MSTHPRLANATRVARRHWFPVLCVGVAAFLVAAEISRRQPSPADWDWLLHSGALVFLVALAAARRVTPAVPVTIRRIRLVTEDGSPSMPTDEVLAGLRVIRRRYARFGIAIGLALMAVFWLWARGPGVVQSVLFWLELAGAALAGYVVGGFVGYGRLGHVLNELGLRPLATPGHPDGAAGLRPVGDLYLRQALIVAMIGVYAGVWWLLIPHVGYEHWRGPYLGIVAVCLVLETAALFLPLQSFHRHMQAERTRLLGEADEAADRVAQLEAAAWRTADQDEAAVLAAECERARSRWEAIDTMPTWPLDVRIRRRFVWSNAAILLPVVLQLVNAPEAVQRVSSAIGGLN